MRIKTQVNDPDNRLQTTNQRVYRIISLVVCKNVHLVKTVDWRLFLFRSVLAKSKHKWQGPAEFYKCFKIIPLKLY